MGKKIKICIIFLAIILTSIVFNIYDIYSVDITTTAWKNSDKDGNMVMYLRLYMKPYNTDNYDNATKSTDAVKDSSEQQMTYNSYGTITNSYWVYNDIEGLESYPDEKRYATIGMFFHKDPACTYSETGSVSMGYRGGIATSEFLNVNTNLGGAVQAKATKNTNFNYEEDTYAAVWNTKGTITSTTTGTGLLLTNPEKAGRTQYRYAIVSMGPNKDNVYVEDNIVTGTALDNLAKKLREEGKNECYVSQVAISKSMKEDGYELSRDIVSFLSTENQYRICTLLDTIIKRAR